VDNPEGGPAEQGASQPARVRELAWLFLRLGTTAFGGPAAHIAMMEDEVIRRRRWMSREKFLDLLGATNLIPGPNSTEMAIHIGYQRGGWPGLLVAGACFIVPAFALVTAIAWMYVRFGSLPQVEGLLYGVKPVIIVVVLQALWVLGRAAVKTRFLALVAVASLAANLLGVNELVVLFGGAAIAVAGGWHFDRRKGAPPLPKGLLAVPALAGVTAGAPAAAAATFALWPLFLVFLKIGSVLFGSGYVLLAFLRADLVRRLGWMTDSQLLDAVAVGQFTPGPVFTTATFIGYLLGGPAAALVATVGIFLPAFFFVAVSGPLVPLLRRSRLAGAALDGVNVSSLALMAAVTWQLGRGALVDISTGLLAVLAAFLLFRYRLNSAWLVVGGGALGAGLHYILR